MADVTTDPLWFKDAVIYETHVRAFADSDGDGIGDFRGLTGKLDYLADLGVTALWLLPFYPSPLRDDGYDIADYDAVNPIYGTLRDFKRFVKEAHDRDLKVITELVINHTSDQHPWFRRAVEAPPGSRHRDFYVWSDDPSRWPETRIIFQDYERSNWTWHPEAGAYYWHRFYHHQPDLNFDSPDVRAAVKKALDHWAAMGVDGMRLDAIPYLFERDGTNNENLPETHEFLKELRSHLDEHWPGRMFLAEANQWPEDAAAYFGDAGDECHMNFHFPLMPRLYMSVAMEDRFPIIDILQQTPDIPENAQWAVFLRNHDELTLEMVTDEERDYMRRVYASDPQMRINLGIRRRLAPLLHNDRRLIELMNALLFSLPGTPVLYYGDEIGMGDNVWLGDRDGVRTPMQWNGDRNAGFSAANPQQLFLPCIIDPEYHYETVNVEAQQANPRSLWWWMKRTIALRRQHPVFGRGTIRFLQPDNPKVLAFVRELDDDLVLVVANLSRHAQACEVDLSPWTGRHPVEMFGATPFPRVGDQPYRLTVGPHGYYWFQLETRPLHVTYAGVSATGPAVAAPETPSIGSSSDWSRLGMGGTALVRSLPDVLATRRWFGGKARTVRRTTVADAFRLQGGDTHATLLVVDVEYATGDPDQYCLPLTFAAGGEATAKRAEQPAAVLAEVVGRGDAEDGVLLDAVHDQDAVSGLLDLIRRRGSISGRNGRLTGVRTGVRLPASATSLSSTPLRADQSNTSILVGDQYVLKLVRRLSEGINPDLEIGRFLTDRTDFQHTPAVVGAVEHRVGRKAPTTIAILTAYVANEGDAWAQALSHVDRFLDDVLARGGPTSTDRGDVVAAARKGLPEDVADRLGTYAGHARLLGERTAQLHAALASDRDDPDFAPEPFTSLYQRSLYQHMRTRTRRAEQVMRQALRAGVAEAVHRDLRDVLDAEGAILASFEHLKGDRLTGMRTRTHGDYHLGQVLWTGRDFQIIDFEGEPAAPVSERRIKRSPLRDVAGMLRSFHYAGHVGVRSKLDRGLEVEHPQALVEAADWWGTWTGVQFLSGYLAATTATDVLPLADEDTARLLGAFLLEKALYELGYELDNRPDWVSIPLRAVRQLALADDD